MQCSRINGRVPIYPEAKDSAITIKITNGFNMSYLPSIASLRTFEVAARRHLDFATDGIDLGICHGTFD